MKNHPSAPKGLHRSSGVALALKAELRKTLVKPPWCAGVCLHGPMLHYLALSFFLVFGPGLDQGGSVAILAQGVLSQDGDLGTPNSPANGFGVAIFAQTS